MSATSGRDARPSGETSMTSALALVGLGLGAAFVGCFLPDYDRIEGKPVTTGPAGPGSTGPAGGQGVGGAMAGGGGVGADGGASSGGAGGGAGGFGPVDCLEPMALPAACSGLGGPPMVAVPIDGGGNYCIDSHEVTNSQYANFLILNPMPMNQPPYCAWNMDLEPMGWTGMFMPGEENQPVGNLDWCDAAAYCASVGKRLCGKVGGGPADKNLVDPVNEQWYRACSNGGERYFPYSIALFEPTTCNGDGFGANGPIEVKTATACEGSFCGVFDLAGNVGEWVDMCDAAMAGATDKCFALGGDYNGTMEAQVACLTFTDIVRTTTSPTIGFRCCADE